MIMIPIKPKDAIWTDEQWLAINDCGHNIIVSAGAGSGKTAVLSERVITNLKKGIHINEMLILTFTKAAAEEMRERIRKKIKKDKSLSNELDLIDSAYITTFDSFALSIAKKYHYLLNVSSDISIIDSSIIEIKKREILEGIFDNYYKNKDGKFIKLISDFCVKDDKDIFDSILKIYNKICMLDNKEEYLDNYINNNFNNNKIKKDIDEYVLIIKNKIDEIRDEIYNLSLYVDSDYMSKVNESVDCLLNSNTYDDIVSSSKKSLPRLPNGSEEIVKNIKEKINKLIKEVDNLCIYNNVSDIEDTIYMTKDYIEAIINIIKDLDREIFKYKFDNDIYEFTDIAIFAIKVLRENDDVRYELKNYFKEIMIDEYQDTNDLQDIFISMIENNNVYMVGDIKQSIYRFRNANPDLFRSKYNNYANNMGGVKIDLNQNFRSRREVLENINLIFDLIMSDSIGGADYSVSHRMIFGNKSYEDKGDTKQNNNMEIYGYDYDKDSMYSKEEIECFIICKDIKDKINNHYKVFDKDEGIIRDINYNDFVILIDRASSFSLYKKIFDYFGIPISIFKDEKMNDDMDIRVINNLVRFIIKVNNKEIDTEFKYLFMSICRSFIYEYSDNDILDFFINNNYKDSDLYKKCFDISKNINNMSNYEVLLRIITDFNIYDNIIKIGNIKASIVKIDNILDSAINLSSIGYDIYGFSNYLQTMIDNNYEIKYSVNLGDADSVKLMTIHKSKGLEYHICYFASLYKDFNISDLKEKFTYDKNYGIIVPYFDQGIGYTIYKDLLKNKYISDEIGEKIRLFYVALTRAKEKMILLLPNKDEDNTDNIHNNLVKDNIRLKYRSIADILYSINNKLIDYYKSINMESLCLSKKYMFNKDNNLFNNINKSLNSIEVSECHIDNNIIASTSFSKKIDKLIDKKTNSNIELGLKFHETLEYFDFKNPNYEGIDSFIKEKIINLLNQDIFKDIKDATIYHEYEFIYEKDYNKYHGIIDLMLEYDDRIYIIDYKLRNIDDDNYINQLNGYRDYIKSITDKEVYIYLYSIIDSKFKELN